MVVIRTTKGSSISQKSQIALVEVPVHSKQSRSKPPRRIKEKADFEGQIGIMEQFYLGS